MDAYRVDDWGVRIDCYGDVCAVWFVMKGRINSKNWKTRVPVICSAVFGMAVLVWLLRSAGFTEHAGMFIACAIGMFSLIMTTVFAFYGTSDWTEL